MAAIPATRRTMKPRVWQQNARMSELRIHRAPVLDGVTLPKILVCISAPLIRFCSKGTSSPGPIVSVVHADHPVFATSSPMCWARTSLGVSRKTASCVVEAAGAKGQDAVVEPHGVFAENRLGRGWMIGSGLASDPMAVTNEQGEFEIAYGEDGTFSFSNVPLGRVWALFPTMESLTPKQLAGESVPIEPREDGQTLDVGELRLRPAHRVRGRIIVSDGKPLPPDVHLTLLGNYGFDSQVGDVSADGRFEFKGLPKGVVKLSPGVKGYELVDRAEIVVDADRDDVLIRMRPKSGEIDRPML